MQWHNNGVIGRGLGAGASSAISGGKFSLGPALIEVEIIRGGEIRPTRPVRPFTPRSNQPSEEFDLVIYRVTINGETTERRFSIPKTRTPVVLKVVGALNTITTSISIKLNSIEKMITKFRIFK